MCVAGDGMAKTLNYNHLIPLKHPVRAISGIIPCEPRSVCPQRHNYVNYWNFANNARTDDDAFMRVRVVGVLVKTGK